MSYTKEISEIVRNRILNSDEVFNYFETPLESLCDKLYLYYKNLSRTTQIYTILILISFVTTTKRRLTQVLKSKEAIL